VQGRIIALEKGLKLGKRCRALFEPSHQMSEAHGRTGITTAAAALRST
jgi:hypothetical protein